MFTYFIENELLSQKQSGFKPGDSCVNQLLAITHQIFSSFDDNYEVRGVFLEISKEWHFFIKCDTRELFTNLNAMRSQEIY